MPFGMTALYQYENPDSGELTSTKLSTRWADLAAETDFTLRVLDDDVADCGSSTVLANVTRGFTTDLEGRGGFSVKQEDLDLMGADSLLGKWLQLCDASGMQACCQIETKPESKFRPWKPSRPNEPKSRDRSSTNLGSVTAKPETIREKKIREEREEKIREEKVREEREEKVKGMRSSPNLGARPADKLYGYEKIREQKIKDNNGQNSESEDESIAPEDRSITPEEGATLGIRPADKLYGYEKLREEKLKDNDDDMSEDSMSDDELPPELPLGASGWGRHLEAFEFEQN